MSSVDQMELSMYLDVLAFQLRQADEQDREEPGGANVVELRRGTIDQIFR